MAKIVECFSIRPLTNIILYIRKITEEVDENNMVVRQTVSIMPRKIPITMRLMKSVSDKQDEISKVKMKYVDEPGYLFIVTDGMDNNLLGLKFITEQKDEQLHKIKVEDNYIYGGDDCVVYNSDIMEKIDAVYERVKSLENEERNLIAKTINAMKRSYKNTGIISRQDLKWLNAVYNKFK